jgi:hypothetical protein
MVIGVKSHKITYQCNSALYRVFLDPSQVLQNDRSSRVGGARGEYIGNAQFELFVSIDADKRYHESGKPLVESTGPP